MPIEYRAVLLGSATTLDELSVYRPQEESTPEGSLIMLELHFAEALSVDTVNAINEQCSGVGVQPWPGNTQIAYASGETLSLYWVKGFAWLPIILGMLALTILPALLGAFIWWLIPEEVKQLINVVVMMLMMMLMMKMMAPMFSSSSQEKPKQIEGRSS